MKNSLSLLALFLSTLSFAQSSPERVIEEISPEKLLVVGRAIESKSTGEQIALTCTEHQGTLQTCKKLQFVWMKGLSTFTIGTPIQLVQEAELKGELKSTFKMLRKQIRRERQTIGGEFFTKLIGVGITGGAVMTVFVLVPGLREAAFLSLFVVLPGTIRLVEIFHIDPFAATVGSLDMDGINATRSPEGWNWSVIPEKVSHNRFYTYKMAIDHLGAPRDKTPSYQLKLLEGKDGQCRIGAPHYSFWDMNAGKLNDVVVMQRLAAKQGCVFDPKATTSKIHILVGDDHRSRRHTVRRFQVLDEQNQKIDEVNATYRTKGTESRQDAEISQLMP